MKIIIELTQKEVRELNPLDADKILDIIKSEISKIETFEGDRYDSNISIKIT